MANVDVPFGYLKTSRFVTMQEAERIKTLWAKAMQERTTVILGDGIEFVSLEREPVMPKAICLHCARPNLASSLWCQGCGAPLYA